MIKYIRSLLILAVILFTVSITAVYAQDPGDPSADDPAAPIDGGISLLLAAGAAYGGKKVHQLHRDKKRVPLDQK